MLISLNMLEMGLSNDAGARSTARVTGASLVARDLKVAVETLEV